MLYASYDHDRYSNVKKIKEIRIDVWRAAIENFPTVNEEKNNIVKTVTIALGSSNIKLNNKGIGDWIDLTKYIDVPDEEKKMVIECEFYGIGSFCGNCFGCGKIDWIRRAKNQKVYRDGIFANDSKIISFIPSGEFRFSDSGMSIQQLPKLFDDEKYCFKCGGTGVNFTKFDELFPNKLWYEANFPS